MEGSIQEKEDRWRNSRAGGGVSCVREGERSRERRERFVAANVGNSRSVRALLGSFAGLLLHALSLYSLSFLLSYIYTYTCNI